MRAALAAAALVVTLSSCGGDDDAAAARDRDFASVTIGMLLSTGGQGGEVAGPSIGAATVAAARVRSDSDATVKIEQADYAGDVAAADAMARDLASKVDAIVVATDDPAVLPAVSDLDVPVVLAYITTDGATDPAGIYRMAPTDSLQAERLVEFLTEHRKLSRLALIFENTAYGSGGAAAVDRAIGRKPGVALVSRYGFDTGGDIHTPVSGAAADGAEALIVWTDNAAEAARVVIDVHRSGHSYQLAVPGNAAVPQFGKNAVAQVVPTAFREGILSVGPWAGPWLQSPRIRGFYREFESTQNDVAPVRTAAVYDAVLLLSQAKASGEIATGLGKVKDFTGAGVPITFDNAREGLDASDVWAWGFTKSKSGAGAEFFPSVDTGGGFFTLIPAGLEVPERYRYMLP